jgi:hypothetical protein
MFCVRVEFFRVEFFHAEFSCIAISCCYLSTVSLLPLYCLSAASLLFIFFTMPGKHKNRKLYADPNQPSGQHLSECEQIQILSLY